MAAGRLPGVRPSTAFRVRPSPVMTMGKPRREGALHGWPGTWVPPSAHLSCSRVPGPTQVTLHLGPGSLLRLCLLLSCFPWGPRCRQPCPSPGPSHPQREPPPEVPSLTPRTRRRVWQAGRGSVRGSRGPLPLRPFPPRPWDAGPAFPESNVGAHDTPRVGAGVRQATQDGRARTPSCPVPPWPSPATPCAS